MFNNTKVVANIIMKGDREKRVKERRDKNVKATKGGSSWTKKEKTKKSLLLCLTAAGAR